MRDQTFPLERYSDVKSFLKNLLPGSSGEDVVVFVSYLLQVRRQPHVERLQVRCHQPHVARSRSRSSSAAGSMRSSVTWSRPRRSACMKNLPRSHDLISAPELLFFCSLDINNYKRNVSFSGFLWQVCQDLMELMFNLH